MNKYSRALHIFRRDLRLEDNTALNLALSQSKEVLCCFIFDPRQVGDQPYRGLHTVQFMVEALQELSSKLESLGSELKFYYGEAAEVLKQILIEEKIEAVYFNRDYTPFSRNRDRQLKQTCDVHAVAITQCGDALIFEPEEILKSDGKPYTIYTPFFKSASKHTVRPTQTSSSNNFGKFLKPHQNQKILTQITRSDNENLLTHGGRSHALKIIKAISTFGDYDNRRNLPALSATTGLSAHHKFGTCSVRDVYHAVRNTLGVGHTLIRELFWRDFFTHIGFHFPYVFKGAFHQKYDSIQWENNQEWFEAWCQGQTGFPIVDAGMRELNATGFMHNRVRMIVASFLTKDLLIDWRWGERYFAQKLIDYDPCVNNGNWQWAASTGCDAQPYFRVFNPWLQQERFDVDGEYIHRWVPELRSVTGKALHALYENPIVRGSYPAVLVDHATQKAKAIRMFAEAKESKNKIIISN